jgi:hypothetical protein
LAQARLEEGLDAGWFAESTIQQASGEQRLEAQLFRETPRQQRLCRGE